MPIFADSPQSTVPNYTPRIPVTLDDQIESRQLFPQPPVVINNTVGPIDIYNILTHPLDPKASEVYVQNNSIQPVYYAYNTDATAAVYHGIIPGAGVANNGTGGKAQFNIRKYNISKISLLSASGNLNVVVETFSEI